MKIIQKKKGVSEVVSVVLIIMITVAAIAVLWTVVIPMIKENTTKGTVCFKASEALSIVDDQFTCFKYNASGDAGASYNNVSVKIAKASSEANVSYAQVIIYYTGGSSESFVKDVSGVAANTENTYQFKVSKNNATGVAIASVITTGKTNTTCTVGPKIALLEC